MGCSQSTMSKIASNRYDADARIEKHLGSSCRRHHDFQNQDHMTETQLAETATVSDEQLSQEFVDDISDSSSDSDAVLAMSHGYSSNKATLSSLVPKEECYNAEVHLMQGRPTIVRNNSGIFSSKYDPLKEARSVIASGDSLLSKITQTQGNDVESVMLRLPLEREASTWKWSGIDGVIPSNTSLPEAEFNRLSPRRRSLNSNSSETFHVFKAEKVEVPEKIPILPLEPHAQADNNHDWSEKLNQIEEVLQKHKNILQVESEQERYFL